MNLHNRGSSLYIKNSHFLSSLDSNYAKANTIAIVQQNGEYNVAVEGDLCNAEEKDSLPVFYLLPMPKSKKLGDQSFLKDYGTRYACYAGAMAGAISSAEMVISLGKTGFMGSYGAGGMQLSEVEKAIDTIQAALPNGPYMINFLSNYGDPTGGFSFIQLCIKKKVPVIEASAFIDLPLSLLYYKVSGLIRLPNGEIKSTRKVIAKVSREEVAQRFMSPPNKEMVAQMLKNCWITQEQAIMAKEIPVGDDVTVEADSGGHTDNRPLVSLLPAILKLRDELQEKYKYKQKVRIGAAGGISTPSAALAAFQMGASYVVTGSVNQACVEAGTSDYVKNTLATVSMADVVMAPCADMFEMGGRVQVIKKGTMYPMNAQKLYELYTKYKSIEDIPENDKKRIITKMLKCSLEEVWEEVCTFFEQVDKRQIALANKNSKHKMALIFRWYLGHSSQWAIDGTEERQMDMQIWCGQSMGAFNNWSRGTYLEKPQNRHVSDVNRHIMDGAAHQYLQDLALSVGVSIDKIPPYVCQER